MKSKIIVLLSVLSIYQLIIICFIQVKNNENLTIRKVYTESIDKSIKMNSNQKKLLLDSRNILVEKQIKF